MLMIASVRCGFHSLQTNGGLRTGERMNVFFYGLFMDETLLASKGIRPSAATKGFVDGFRLRIGQRATLLADSGGRAYGVMMDIAESEAKELYAEASVADYAPEPVTVELVDGAQAKATCYNLPVELVSGTNKEYAKALLSLAKKLGFPESYLEEIRRA